MIPTSFGGRRVLAPTSFGGRQVLAADDNKNLTTGNDKTFNGKYYKTFLRVIYAASSTFPYDFD
jgi:hypothetical protein